MAQVKKILVADDEKPLAKALELKLKKENYDVSVASNGEEAIELLSKNKFDLALIDLIMPKKDGFAVLEEMQKRKIKIKIAVLSNLAQEEDVNRVKKLGADDYFVKANTPLSDIVSYVKAQLK